MSRSLESVGLGLTGAIVESLSRLGGDDGERTEGLTRVSIEVEREGECGVFNRDFTRFLICENILRILIIYK